MTRDDAPCFHYQPPEGCIVRRYFPVDCRSGCPAYEAQRNAPERLREQWLTDVHRPED